MKQASSDVLVGRGSFTVYTDHLGGGRIRRTVRDEESGKEFTAEVYLPHEDSSTDQYWSAELDQAKMAAKWIEDQL